MNGGTPARKRATWVEGLYQVLLNMEARDKAGETVLLTDEEAVEIIEPVCFRPAVWDLVGLLTKAYCGSGQAKETGTSQPEPSSAAEKYMARQRGLGNAFKDGMLLLWGWFLDDTRAAKGESGNPMWLKALRQIPRESINRDREAPNYLIYSAKNWLRRKVAGTDPGFVLDENTEDALRHEAFVKTGIGEGGSPAYTLKGKDYALGDMRETEALARTLGWRHFHLRAEDHKGLPYPSDIRDVLIEAMEKARRGFTLDQAKILVRWVFNLPPEQLHAPLPEEHPEVSQSAGVSGSELPGEGVEQETSHCVMPQLPSEPDDFTSVVEALVAEIQTQDGSPAGKRPDNSRQGRVARYFLDFEIWNGWPLADCTEARRLQGLVPGPRRAPLAIAAGTYNQSIFAAWSGVADSSVSDWRCGRRAELLALVLVQGLGWSRPRALNFLDEETPVERRKNHPEARALLARVLWALRVRFLHRKPEFVSAGPLERWMADQADA